MEFKSTIWAVVIFSMIIIAVGVIVDERGTQYSSNVTSDLGGDFNKLDAVATDTETQQGSINPQSGEASSSYEDETFRGGYGIITNIFSPLRVVFGSEGILQSAAERWGIPNYILQGFITMFIVAIIFGIVAIVFRLGRVSA